MLTRLWRMSHLALSLVVVLFLLLASITGIILSFDPIQKEWAPLSVKGARSLSVAEVLFNINGHFETILDIEILENDAVKISTMDMDSSKDGDFIIDPFSASRLGDVPHSNNFFQWVTSLHRSLFLKRTGRFIVGLSSFLFSLIIITGIVLIVKREGSWLGLFRKTIRTRSDQYLHLTVSKCTWIPLFIIAITGVYLSLLRFDVVPEPDKVSFIPLAKDVSGTNELSAYDFPIFQQLPITKIKKLEFPFSDDAIDPYILYTKHERYIVHQYSGEILEAYRDPIINKISTWSNRLHTGQGSVIWSLILGGSTSGILFLVYTGFSISWQRLRGKETQLFGAQEAEIILLYGSENGSTRRFANALFKALIGAKQKVFLDTLNNYTSFPKAKTILVLTATYGDGEAPSNASDFYDKLAQVTLPKSTRFAVLGFGSHAYPKFGQYAKEVYQKLLAQEHLQPMLTLEIIHNQSVVAFDKWTKSLGQVMNLSLRTGKFVKEKVPRLDAFRVTQKRIVRQQGHHTFLLHLKPNKQIRFLSGDLFNFYPDSDPVKRSYSIAKRQDGSIMLAIKWHELGVASNLLFGLEVGDEVYGHIEQNKHFHFPEDAKQVLLISNGTGISPFLGMIEKNTDIPIDLFWGGRSKMSFSLYQSYLDQAKKVNSQFNYHTAFSREEDQMYVQDLIRKRQDEVVGHLLDGGYIMICGSVAMQRDVLDVLREATHERKNTAVDEGLKTNRILMDCY